MFTVYAGAELASGEFLEGIVILGGLIAASAVGYYKREPIRDGVVALRKRRPF